MDGSSGGGRGNRSKSLVVERTGILPNSVTTKSTRELSKYSSELLGHALSLINILTTSTALVPRTAASDFAVQ